MFVICAPRIVTYIIEIVNIVLGGSLILSSEKIVVNNAIRVVIRSFE